MSPLVVILDAPSISEPHWIAKFHSKPQNSRWQAQESTNFVKFHYREKKDHIILLLIAYLDRVPTIHMHRILECVLECQIQNG